jgi:hypothetical protein
MGEIPHLLIALQVRFVRFLAIDSPPSRKDFTYMKCETERRRFQKSFSEKEWAKVLAHPEFKKAWDSQGKRLKEDKYLSSPGLSKPL